MTVARGLKLSKLSERPAQLKSMAEPDLLGLDQMGSLSAF